MTFKPYQPWYDDTRDYNTNAPSYYDYLANSVNLEKVQTEAINNLLVRDVDFLDSDEIHVDKLTDWHTDDPNHQNKTSFKAHVITSPKNLTYTFDGVDYVAPNSIQVLDSGLYSPDYSKIISNAQARLNEVSTTAKKADDKSLENAKSITALSNKTNEQQLQIDSKQAKLTTSMGIELKNDNNIGLTFIDNYQGDLNAFYKTAYAHIQNNQCVNLPEGIQLPALLHSFISGDSAITQYLISDVNGKIYTRGGVFNNWKTTWGTWFIPTSHDEVRDQIDNVNKGYNLNNPEIYSQHAFSAVGTVASGNWGFYFFNDTNSRIYNVKLTCGRILNASKGSVLAQQNVSDLKAQGVPIDFINKAKNTYIFRAGYYLGNTLKRVAFTLRTKEGGNLMEIVLTDFDGDGSVINTDVVAGHEIVPAAVTYNN